MMRETEVKEWTTPTFNGSDTNLQKKVRDAITKHFEDAYGSEYNALKNLNIDQYLVVVKVSSANSFTKYIVVRSTDTPDVNVTNSTPYQLIVHCRPEAK